MADSGDITTTNSIREFIISARRLSDLDCDENIFEQRLVSSMFILQLIGFLETKYQITVKDEEVTLANFGSVSAMARFVQCKSQTKLTEGNLQE